jgi:hypothetical protein
LGVAKEGIDVGKSALGLAEDTYNFIDKIWQKINIGDPIVTTVTYIYPKSQMKTTRTYRIPSGRRSLFGTKITLPAGNNFQIISIFDVDTGVDYASLSVQREEEKVVFDPAKLPSSCERLMVTTLNDIDMNFLRALVDVRVSEVASREEKDKEKHWITAAIKDEGLLRPFYKNATLEDVDVGVGINVDRHYNTVLKNENNPLIRLMRANQNIFMGIDRNRRNLENIGKAQRRRILQKEMKKTKEDIFSQLARLCLPEMFKDYVTTDNPNLLYIDAKRSENLMTFGNIIIPIPSRMTVTIYTTLRLEDPAQKGYLTFHRDDFCNDVEKIIRTHFILR